MSGRTCNQGTTLPKTDEIIRVTAPIMYPPWEKVSSSPRVASRKVLQGWAPRRRTCPDICARSTLWSGSSCRGATSGTPCTLPPASPATGNRWLINYIPLQRWYSRKLIAIGSLFLGIDSSGGLIPPWNWFLLYKNLERERRHMQQMKSLLYFSFWYWGALGNGRIFSKFGSYSVPCPLARFLTRPLYTPSIHTVDRFKFFFNSFVFAWTLL